MKRSSKVSLVLIAGASGLALSGCVPPEYNTQVPDNGGTFSDKAECVAVYDENTCEAAEKEARSEHLKNAPKTTREQCIEDYGPDMCVPSSEYGGSGNSWMPLMAGYMLGSMTSKPAPLYYAPGSYKDADRMKTGGPFPVYSSGTGYAGKSAGTAQYVTPSASNLSTKAELKSSTSMTPPSSQRGGFGSSFKPSAEFKSSYIAKNPTSFGKSTMTVKSATSARGGFGSSSGGYSGS